MQAFETLTATAVPLRMENVDTDQIIPAKYLTAVTKEGMGAGLFSWIRYNADGSPKADFVINKPEYCRRRGPDCRAQFRQRLQPRTCRLGADRLWLPLRDLAGFCRHLLQ